MLTLGPIDVMVLDEATGTVYHFNNVAEIFEALDITPSELVYGFCMPDGTVVNDRFSFHKIYIGDLEKLSKDIVIIKADRTAMIVPDARIAAIVTGYDIASIGYSLDTDGYLDLPYRFVSLGNYIKTMGDSFSRQLQAMKPRPNMDIRPDKQTLFKILSQLEKFTDELETPKPVFPPTQSIGKTNEVDSGEYVINNGDLEEYAEARIEEYKKQAKNISLPEYKSIIPEPEYEDDFEYYYPKQGTPFNGSLSLKLIDLATKRQFFFSSYNQMAKFLDYEGDPLELKKMRYKQEPIKGYLIRLSNDDSPLPGPF